MSPVPLEYGSRETLEKLSEARRLVEMGVGLLAGFGLIVVPSVGVAIKISSNAAHVVAVIYLMLAVLLGSILTTRLFRPQSGRGWVGFATGGLLGMGIALLIEGLCFAGAF